MDSNQTPDVNPALFKRADRVSTIEMSEIVLVSEAARRKHAKGEHVISLGTGEPDFDTPDYVKEAAIAGDLGR